MGSLAVKGFYGISLRCPLGGRLDEGGQVSTVARTRITCYRNSGVITSGMRFVDHLGVGPLGNTGQVLFGGYRVRDASSTLAKAKICLSYALRFCNRGPF